MSLLLSASAQSGGLPHWHFAEPMDPHIRHCSWPASVGHCVPAPVCWPSAEDAVSCSGCHILMPTHSHSDARLQVRALLWQAHRSMRLELDACESMQGISMEFDVPLNGSDPHAIATAYMRRAARGSGRPPTLICRTASGTPIVFRWNPGQDRARPIAGVLRACPHCVSMHARSMDMLG